MATPGNTPSKADFNDPPVIAVVLTVFFEPVPGLQASHFSALRERWRADLPNTTELPPLRPINRDGEEAKVLPIGSAWPLPYMMFTSEDDGRSIAFQSDRFIRSWSFGEEGQKYPGFNDIAADLKSHLDEFADVIRDETKQEIVVTGSMCDYTNDLPELPAESLLIGLTTRWQSDEPYDGMPATLRAKYSGMRLHLCDEDELQGCSVNLSLDVDEDGAMLGISSGFDVPSEGESADLPLGGLEHAHDRLIEIFLEFTSPSMQEQWGRKP